MGPVQPASSGVLLVLHVQPGLSRTELAGLHGEALKVRLASPPVDGAANAELLRFLARLLRVPRCHIGLIGGEKTRAKRVEIRGLSEAEVRERLGLL